MLSLTRLALALQTLVRVKTARTKPRFHLVVQTNQEDVNVKQVDLVSVLADANKAVLLALQSIKSSSLIEKHVLQASGELN